MAHKFYRRVDLRSRSSMTEFLRGHFRYNTLNYWNRSTSYANNVKIYNLGLGNELEQKLYAMLDCEEFWESINALCYEFNTAHNYAWQAAFNGRSNGYLVLYQGGRIESGYKSYCTACGQKNYKTVEESGNVCGRCGKPARVNFKIPDKRVYVTVGAAVDQDEDFEGWDLDTLRERTRLVQEFDKLCDQIVEEAVSLAENFSVEDEIIYVPTTKRRLTPISGKGDAR